MTSPAPRRGEAATRDVLAAAVAKAVQDVMDARCLNHPANYGGCTECSPIAEEVTDAVLALPEVAELRGQVERALALANSWDKQAARYRNEDLAPPARALREHAAHLRAALASSSATEPESAGQEVRGG